MKRKSESYDELRRYIDTVPVINAHEHYASMTSIACMDEPLDVFAVLTKVNYFTVDLLSNAYNICNDTEFEFRGKGFENDFGKYFNDKNIDFDTRCEMYEKMYNKTNKTALARAMALGLKECWGLEKIDKDNIRKWHEKFPIRDEGFYNKTMNSLGIKANVINFLDIKPFVTGKSKDYSEYSRFAFPLLELHNIHTLEDIVKLEKYFECEIKCLDDYIKCFNEYFQKCLDFGVVCMKDQSAYKRSLDYKNPSKADAEKVFRMLTENPDSIFGDNEVRDLDDWLFNYYIIKAGENDLPVQIHTGYLSGLRNDITNANAIKLIPLLERFPDVRFSLLHGNWPYMDECIYLARNYPNVWIDLSFIQPFDPIYCIELMKRAIMTIPHTKIMAFGGDTATPEWTAGFLIMARDNIVYALSELVDCGWFDMFEAKEVIQAWMFNNANDFFRLGFKKIQ